MTPELSEAQEDRAFRNLQVGGEFATCKRCECDYLPDPDDDHGLCGECEGEDEG